LQFGWGVGQLCRYEPATVLNEFFNNNLCRYSSLLRRGFNELYMAFTVSNRCVEDAQAEKAGSFNA
jgi:hypothetical protein